MSQSDKPSVVVSWSSGKDCAFALHQVKTEGQFEGVGLLTTLNQENERVAMHGVRKELLQRQMESLKLPDGPMFSNPIVVEVGEKVLCGDFAFADVVPFGV